MRNFILGALTGSVVTAYFTGHIKLSSEGIAFTPPLDDIRPPHSGGGSPSKVEYSAMSATQTPGTAS